MKTQHQDLSSSFAEQARKAMKAVVQIHVQGFSDENVRSILDPRFLVPAEWTGSGFFIQIENEEGFILTNAHVARNATNIEILSPITSEEVFQVDLIGLVKTMEPDVALLKMRPDELKRFKQITGGKVPYLKLADSSRIKRGMDIKAIGYPLGMDEPNISGGEISNFISGDISIPERIVTDAAINPGNSGGPSILRGGGVIGLNTAIIEGANNIGFITPINFAKNIFESLITWKYSKLTDLAGTLQKNSESNAKLLKQKTVEGVIVTNVVQNGMMDSAGIMKWDIILSINGHVFDRHGIYLDRQGFHKKTIYDIVRLIPVGSNVELEVLRKGKLLKLNTLAIPRPNFGVEHQPIIEDRKYVEFEGMIIQRLTSDIVTAIFQAFGKSYIHMIDNQSLRQEFIVVSFIDQGSTSDEMFIEAGEIITSVNGQRVCTLEAFKKQIDSCKRKKQKSVLIETRGGFIGNFQLKKDLEIKIKKGLDTSKEAKA